MTDRIIPRTESGMGARVVSFNRITSRPRLARALGLIVLHYTGVNKKYHGLTVAEVQKVIRMIERLKPGEYNYVIDWAGNVYELAGEYQGAHCKGYNDRAYGVLFLNGVGEPATDAQILAYRFLRGCLLWVGAVTPTVWQVPHKWVAATACPGDVFERYDALVAA